MLNVAHSLILVLLLPKLRCEQFTLGYLTGSQRLPGDKEYARPGLTISGAISLAVSEINAPDGLLGSRGHSLTFIVAETYGEEAISIKQTASLWTRNVSAYIGPQETCTHEGRMAAAFDIVMISYFCTDYETSDKTFFPTFARTRPPISQISKSVAAVLLAFQWSQVAFFYLNSPEYAEFGKIASSIIGVLESVGILVTFRKWWDAPYHHGYSDNPFVQMIRDTYAHVRIYVILGHYYEHLGLMVAMEEMGLFDKGEYFVVGVDIEQYDSRDPEKYLRGMLLDNPDPVAQAAYRSYIGVLPSAARGYENFTEQVNYYCEQPPFNFVNPLKDIGANKIIRPEAAYLYDAVYLYANALVSTMEANESTSNTTAIMQRFFRTHYHSILGYMVYMDENGDAEGNYSLVGRQMGFSGYGLYPVGAFTRHSNMSLPMLSLTQEIDWISGQPPLAAPPCGFRGEKCFSHMEVIACVCGGVALVVSIVSLVVYRNWRYEQELDSLLWKLDYRDIQLSDSYKLARNVHTSQVSLSSNPDSDFRYSAIFTPIGIYKGRIFAIKRIPKKSVDITRAMKKELKIIRDLRHDNLNGFIGACTEPPNICIVTEYCARGSLKDIMENEDVKLDNMFIASLVADILRGMLYLHDSALRYHGNLKASNCLVDSRWVVKLADFGLTEFKRDAEYTGTDQHSFLQHTYHVNRAGSTESLHCKCDGLLYKAPELLRALVQSPSSALGSPKGDVYSFGIILYELHSRQGPFGDLSMSPATILTRVMYPACNQEPFRPRLDLLENSFDFVRDCVTECWAETPEDRPDFKVIRTRLRPLRKGMKPNIFDNMIAMMEKYANNLEQLVDERTDQLVEEKKKTEALLFEMLPRSVAEQLRRGTSVEAESFDSVTIYFSDIVGFTAMSAESTPLQVVDFLNDLYTCFDSIVGNYDVYKVETIGDAYMVVSGLPIRNGEQHAGEIASMSLDLLEAVKRFTVRHRPHDDLKLRIGIHSGPVCAGVVGLKMPRYCLFGDTVNTASRMESTGEALKIHCSAECKRLLDHLQGYNLKERGAVELKGKGAVVTYWLTGEDPYHRSVRAEQRTHRRNQIKLKHSGSKMKKQGAMPDNSTSPCPNNNNNLPGQPRSLLKIPRNNSVTLSPLPLPDPTTSPLTRCSSLESPKKLRFAPHDNRYPSGGIGIPELSRTSPSELDRRADRDSSSKRENIRLLAYNQNSSHDDENDRLLPNQCDGNARSFPENSRSCPTELTVRDPLLSSAIDEDYRRFSTDDSENNRLLPPDGSRNFTNTISDNARFRHEPCPEFCRSEESCDEEDGGLVLKMNRNSSNNPSSCNCNEIRSCKNSTSICNCNEISCNNSCNETNRCCSANSSCNESSLSCNKPNRSIQGSTCDLVSQSPTSPKFSNICCNNSPSPNLVSYQTPYETYSLENPRERNNNAPYSPIKRGDKCEHKFEHNASSMRGKSLSRVEEHFCSSSSCPCVSTDGFIGTAGDMGGSADMSGAVAAKYLNGLVGRGEALSAPNTPLMVAHSESDVTRVPLLSETPM